MVYSTSVIANHIHHALQQVQDLQYKLFEKQRFKGYSGRARAMSGTVALLACVAMSWSRWPANTISHLFGWGVVFLIGLILNFGAALYWFLFDPEVKRNIRRLRPAFDVLPPIVVGGVLTLALIRSDLHSYLFGMWMCLFGLANLSARHILPKGIAVIGAYYILCGAVFLLWFPVSFLNPWPMGLIFFFGEWAGGVVLHFDEGLTFRNFFKIQENSHVEAR